MANNNWETPQKYIESARVVMGSIDIDPASNDNAQKTVKAATFFTEENSGLEQDWIGNVWLNPPFGRGLARPFMSRLVQQLNDAHTEQAIVLTNNVPDTTWWSETIGKQCTMLCLPDHRISFIDPETGKRERGNDRNQLITYIGSNQAAFVAEFSQYGLCVVPWRVD